MESTFSEQYAEIVLRAKKSARAYLCDGEFDHDGIDLALNSILRSEVAEHCGPLGYARREIEWGG
ncbi:hypothetical protein I6E68_02340 [Salinibacterium sp. NSLL150]|uniref:hypothetical protein n=1 Tax=unclassified Salinibacterium TaxID=2632331 RepID=UPI0018CF0B1A|nr:MULTISPECIES: hypothetical protein [unclassified Salinibacterium]MBH0097975.1 hypothetical protein [Salinibacterium sp. NSLL35]MBH0100730.1 hypothetical protein [Salinibacterium sp. NSLL150]MBH0103489.1 hypothetical protein [Salinibacterium sp. NSLL16]MBH0106250.1 hypothetical protein [Salinibacterium sp. NSLL17]